MKKLLILSCLISISCGEVVESVQIIHFEPKKDIPINFSWEKYVSHFEKQLCNDCVLNATISALEIQFQIDHNINIYLDLSEGNIHNCMGYGCTDSWTISFSSVLNFIQNYGVMEEAYSPYKKGILSSCENCQDSLTISENNFIDTKEVPFISYKEYYKIFDNSIPYENKKEYLVQALQHGPVIIDNQNWRYNISMNSDILYCVANDWTAPAHATIIVGYENNGETFLVKNSHGEGKILKLNFKEAKACGFADSAYQLKDTFQSDGYGKRWCYSKDYLKVEFPLLPWGGLPKI
jgi:hypothetical protein